MTTASKFLATLLIAALTYDVSAQQLDIYTESLPPHQILQQGKIAGSATEQVRKMLKTAGLNGNFHLVPWARAYNIASTTPNTLIYSMNRTKEREPYFHWLAVVGKIENKFISLRQRNLTLHDVNEAKRYSTAVIRDGYAHHFLLNNGFVEDKNLYVVATTDKQISLLMHGKIDFLFTDIHTIKYTLKQQHIDDDTVHISLSRPDWTRDLYLAANIHSDAQLVKKLTSALNATSAQQ